VLLWLRQNAIIAVDEYDGAVAPSKHPEGPLLVGDVIAGKYRIDGVAGEGGMGIVYEAEHVILRQRVAVKVMLPGALPSTEALDRFSLEASAIARIVCEHVVRVMDAGTMPSGAPYLVMEYLEGSDLETILARRGALPAGEVVDVALQALEALAHAHAARVVHGDLKSANLFQARLPDGRSVIKLVDFGLAMSVDFDDLTAEPGRVAGSPRYMSPEQLRKRVLDPRTDLWSLGVVMYELLTGVPPFDGNLSELVEAILHRPHVPVRERRDTVTEALSNVVERCLKKEPVERWGSAAELARALGPHGSGAWQAAVPRIERALAKAAPAQEPRRYENFDAALEALDSRRRPGAGAGSAASADQAPVSSPATLGPTIPAPPSNEASKPRPRPEAAVTLPSVATPGAAAASAGDAPFPGSALRILMIDDSEFVLGVHAEVLEEAGFEVRSTTSPAELDALLDSWKPHVVLMDVEMPGASGEELCRRVRAKLKAKAPVVFVSNLPKAELEARAGRAGADAFVTKTGDWPGFVAFVRNICAMTYSPEHLP
jgi:serine/threonine-protein kinase